MLQRFGFDKTKEGRDFMEKIAQRHEGASLFASQPAPAARQSGPSAPKL
jgi:hypothetical protein